MASSFKSTLLINRDATPKVLTDAMLSGGMRTETKGSLKQGGADQALTDYRLISIPSDARLSRLFWQADTLGSGAILDVAVYFPTSIPLGGGAFLASGSAAAIIGTGFFATGLTGPAATAITEITNQSLNYSIPLQETALWNVLGFVSDPMVSFDVGFRVRVATATAGYVGLFAEYQY